MLVTAAHVVRPSNARVVRVDGFAPVPRGTTQRVPAPLSWPAKDPGDVLDYQLDVSEALAGDTNDGVCSLAVTVVPSGDPADLTVASAALDGSAAVLWLSGGRAGFAYAVTVTLGTESGRMIVRTVVLPVLPLSGALSANDELMSDTVNPFTDENGNPLVLTTNAGS